MTHHPAIADRLIQVRPFDEHNRTLVENVHPPAWTNPTPDGRYNMVVIGAGTAGLVSSAICANLGGKVALIERDLMGGDCLNIGCVPSKALIRCAHAAHAVRTARAFGIHVNGEPEIDFPAIMERLRRLRADISKHDSAARFRDMGVDVYLGDAAFAGPDSVRVGDRTLRFVKACITTGAGPFVPPIEGIEDVDYLTNESLFSLTELPQRLAVLGGGPIGSEMAQAFARLGAEVHMVEQADQILTREDRDAAEIVRNALAADGVRFHFQSTLQRVREESEEKILTLGGPNGSPAAELRVDALLVAVGRAPNVKGLGLEQAGVSFDEKTGIEIDDRLQTTNPRIFAAGDCASKYKFTHAADFMARTVVRNALFFGRGKLSKLTIPWCTYTDPEIAHVGLYAPEAEEQGFEIETITIGLDEVDRAILEGATEGFLKVHRRKGSSKILGATLVAPHAGDMIGEISLAITSGADLGDLSGTIHPYPTIGEVMRIAGDRYSRTRLTPLVEKLFSWWLRWRR